jgi:hypothetical protein
MDRYEMLTMLVGKLERKGPIGKVEVCEQMRGNTGCKMDFKKITRGGA